MPKRGVSESIGAKTYVEIAGGQPTVVFAALTTWRVRLLELIARRRILILFCAGREYS